MYRVGFGDCFLVTFPGDRHILVDCGVHARGDIGTLGQVLDDIGKLTRRRLDLVIASHPHEDHVNGFARGEQAFRQFAIGEIWLPWTEDPGSARAHQLHEQRARVASAIASHPGAAPVEPDVEAVLGNTASAEIAVALELLRSGFGTGAKVRFLAAGESFADAAGISGLSARLLGPPKAEAALKHVRPPRSERYLKAAGDGAAVWVGDLTPFGAEWVASEGSLPRLSPRDERRLVRGVEASPATLAFALDRSINNTSLVTLFSYRGRSLLFPGDAQYGSWNAWLGEEDAAALLATLDFYKVSHHGSENATPKAALEWMVKDGLVAMASTQSWPWSTIPHESLLAALTERTKGRLVRSDLIEVAGAPGLASTELAPVFERGAIWIDCRLSI
jgi:beta-lactamase superfamily II metal-dependent hydrolase